MTRFKLKSYSKVVEGVTRGANYIKKNPTLPISAASLGLIAHNTAVNSKTRVQDSEYKQRQLDSIDKLTQRLDRASNVIESSSKILHDSMVENTNAVKNNTSNRGIVYNKPADVETKRRGGRGLLSKIRLFSIESGSYDEEKMKPTKVWKSGLSGTASLAPYGVIAGFIGSGSTSGMISGGLVGAGVGAVLGVLIGLASRAIFNVSEIYTSYSSTNLIDEIKEDYNEGDAYCINGDPKRFTVNVLIKKGVAEILLVKPSTRDLFTLNKILDNYCKSYKHASYNSVKIDGNSYIIELPILKVVSIPEVIFTEMIEQGFKINILTDEILGYKNK